MRINIKEWWERNRTFFSIVAVGHTAKQVEEVLFDWLLYGTVVGFTVSIYGAVWGSVVGFLIMAPLSALVCYIYLKLYDWAKIDLFGFEALKEVREELEGDGWWKRMMRKLVRLGDVPAFFVLSINSDPFMVTVYLRKQTEAYKGLSPRDWRIFWSSVLVSNAYWTLRWTVIVGIVVWIYSVLPPGTQEIVTAFWTGITNFFTNLF